MGTSEFAVPTLFKLSESGFLPVAVYTRAPAHAGARGLEIRKTPVHLAADYLGIPVLTPISLRDAETQKAFNNLAADVTIVAAYGLILPISFSRGTEVWVLELAWLIAAALAGRGPDPASDNGGRFTDWD